MQLCPCHAPRPRSGWPPALSITFLFMIERSHREAAVWSIPMIFSLILIHSLPEANKSGLFTGMCCHRLCLSSASPQNCSRAMLYPAREGPAPQAMLNVAPRPWPLEHLCWSHLCPDALDGGSGGHVPCTGQPCKFRPLSPATPPAFLFKQL